MKKYIIYLSVAISLVTVSGCNNLLDINTNPNQLTVTKPDFILSGALVATAAIKSGGDANAYAGMWAGYISASGSYSQSGDLVRTYNLTTAYGNGVWGDNYNNLSNYQYIENNVGSLKGYDNYVAVCEIMKAYDFANLVDIFGNIPYKQALTGFTYLYPAYDNGSDIYPALSLKLDSAVALIHNAPVSALSLSATTDIMFKGDMTRWAKLANTLNLRLLLRQSQVPSSASFITSEIAKINANGYGFLGAGEDAMINPGYAAAQNLQAPFWQNYGENFSGTLSGQDYDKVSDYAVTFFNNTSDPRKDYFFRSPGDNPGVNSKTGYVGVPFGAIPTSSISSAQTSGFGIGILASAAQSTIFISAAQSAFLQAEAVQRSWSIPGFAVDSLYHIGIEESFRILGFPKPAAAAYTFYHNGVKDVDWSSSPDKIEAIITQKWAANYATDDLEAWADLRRLGLPLNVPLSLDPGRISATSPVRLLYPQSEYNSNATNVAKQGTISQFTSKIFWNQ